MPTSAIALLLGSAFLHAIWNLILKNSEDKFIAMGWQVILSSIAAIIALFFIGLPPQSMWLFAGISTVLEVLYFLLLMYAYSDHDFSLIYPIARGAAPALLALWAFIFLGEVPSAGGFFGILLIILGMVFIGATSLIQNHENKPHLRGIILALGVALLISIYTIVDGSAVKGQPSQALPYALSMFTFVPFMTTPWLVRRSGWGVFLGAFKQQPYKLILGGALGVVAYTTALFAYSYAPLNYSEAIREVSVVIGAVLGWKYLGEPMGGYRSLGAVIIFGGIVLIALLG